MTEKKPRTRVAAAAPQATVHLTPAQQAALEAGGEAEHHTGRRREALLRRAARGAKPRRS